MSVLTQTLDATSIFAEEAAAAMCLLSMKMNPSSPESLAAASDYHLTQHPPPPHNTNQLLPMSLSTSHDYDVLSPLQCYIRQNCIEFFAADDNGSGYVAKGRQTQITLGRVGIRCVYCKHATERATQSASFPKQIDKIYSAASMIQCRHFPSCVHIPKAVKDELARLKKQGNGSVKMQKYWAEGARELGFVDTDHDIRFIPTVSPMEDVEYTTSNTVALYGGGNTMNDTKFHSFATPARPRIVTPFPTENNLAPSGAVFMGEGRVAPFLEGIDMGLVQDHVFMAFAQMETIILTRTDKVGPWKDKICGTKGLRCRHCQGRCLIKGKSQGKWFPSSAKNLGQTTTMNSIVKHTCKCPHAPKEVKNAMASLLHASSNDSTTVKKQKKKYGSRKEFFERVFDRMTTAYEPRASLQSRVPAFSPIVVQVQSESDNDDDDDSDYEDTVTAGSKRSRALSFSDVAARKRAAL